MIYHKFTRRLSFAVMGAAYGIGELGAPEWCWHPLLRLGSRLDRWRR